MVTMAISTLDTELTCSICLEFYKDPYQLPCMHSFCKQCLIEFSKPKITSEDDDCGCSKGTAKPTPDKDENVLECPECRHIATLDDKGIDGLPKNFTLANIVKKYAKQEDKEEKKYPCDICDTEPPRDAVKCCLQCGFLYCNGCLSQVHPSKGKLKTHKLVEPSEHQYSESISPDDSKLIDNLLSSTNNLDILKRKVERKIKEIQTNIDNLQETGDRRKGETQVVFNRLGTMLKTKEKQCISEVDGEVEEKTDTLILQLSSWRQFAEDITRMIKDAKFAVEDFPKKTTRTHLQALQNRILEMEKKQFNVDFQNLTPTCGVVNLDDIEGKLETVKKDTFEKKDSHKWNISFKLIPMRNGASISVAWTKIPEKDMYDLIVECTLQNGIKERTIIGCIQTCQHKIENLRPGTPYNIYVAVHGESDTERSEVRVQTLECIKCSSFTLNGKCANEDTFVSNDSKTMIPDKVSNRTVRKYSRISGTTGTIDISFGCLYWETKTLFSIPKRYRTGDVFFEIGICSNSSVDRIANLFKNYNAYSFSVVKRGTRDARLEFSKEGQDISGYGKNLEWNSEMVIHFGYYINMDKRTFYIIDVTQNCILWTFYNIKTTVPLVPVFVHYYDDTKPTIEMSLLTGEDIKEIPPCMSSLF